MGGVGLKDRPQRLPPTRASPHAEPNAKTRKPQATKIPSGKGREMKELTVFTMAACLATATAGLGANLIVNGDFESGNTGFTTDYSYVAPPAVPPVTVLGDPKTYTVHTDPHDVHTSWVSYGDHTSGSGNMLIANATDATLDPVPYGDVVWEQTVAVIADTDYEFSYWIALSYSTNPPLLQCLINGTEVGQFDAAAATLGSVGWTQVSYIWNSGPAVSATIQFIDQRPMYSGDDYALDDISLLQEHCETAFALGDDATCFTELGFGNWGWSNVVSDGESLTWPLWAAAGQCDTGKGTLVGTVTVSYNDATDTVSVDIDLDEGYTLYESHVYAGDAQVPVDKNGKPTVAPGQYYIEDDLEGDIYVIVHAVVCWYE